MNNSIYKKGVSVLVRCYNSTDVLTETLDALMRQNVSEELDWEVLIVDNNSEDDLHNFIEKYRSSKLNIKYMVEKKAGSLYSQIAGITASEFEYVLFCDDDNQLDENYLQLTFDFMENKSNANIGALGGRSTAKTEPNIQLPDWFEEHQINYAVGEQADRTGKLPITNELWSAGTIIRKEIYLQLQCQKVKHILEGRVGKSGAGEDTELFLWFKISGYDLYYWSELHFYHFIRQNRLSRNYLETLRSNIQDQMEVMKGYRILLIISRYNFFKKILELVKVPIFFLMNNTLKQSLVLNFVFGVSIKKTHDERLIQAVRNFKSIRSRQFFLFFL